MSSSSHPWMTYLKTLSVCNLAALFSQLLTIHKTSIDTGELTAMFAASSVVGLQMILLSRSNWNMETCLPAFVFNNFDSGSRASQKRFLFSFLVLVPILCLEIMALRLAIIGVEWSLIPELMIKSAHTTILFTWVFWLITSLLATYLQPLSNNSAYNTLTFLVYGTSIAFLLRNQSLEPLNSTDGIASIPIQS